MIPPTPGAPPIFRLFTEERRWWSFADYGVLLDLVCHLRPRRVLEFGPGHSTRALVEGGAEVVVSCEDNPDWLAVWQRDLLGLPVVLVPYTYSDPLTIPGVDRARFDFGFIDGPHPTDRRGLTITYAAERCDVIAAHDALAAPVRAALEALGPPVQYLEYRRTPNQDAHAIGVVTLRIP